MTQAINSYNVLIDRFQAFANGHYMINAFTHGILPAIDEPKDKLYPWMHVLCSGIVGQPGQAQYSWTVYFFDLPRDKADAHENKREALSDCIRLAQDLIYEIDNGNVLFGDTVDLLPGAAIVPGIDEWTNTLTGVELTFTMAVPDDYDACAIPADFSVGSGTDTSTPGVSSLSFSESLENVDGVVTLDNDEESPGNTKYYGTNSSGVKGWYTLSATFNCSALENCTVFANLQTQVQNIEDTYVESVTGLDTDNTDPQNPVVQIAVDGVTITGSGTSADPLVANGGGGAFIPLAGTGMGAPVTGDIEISDSGTRKMYQDDGSVESMTLHIPGLGVFLRSVGATTTYSLAATDTSGAFIEANNGVNDSSISISENGLADAATYPFIFAINSKRIQFNGQAAPTVSDDNTLGYGVDSFWIYDGGLWICTSASIGAAAWNQVGSAGATWGSIAGTLSNQTDLQSALDGKVDENSAITGATKTKITYDAKGLVTAGADAGISDINGLQTALDAKDALPVVVSSNQTAANDGRYINVASATYTDPIPADGKGFVVFVRNGTATVGGTGYAVAGTIIYRIYHSGAWANYKYQEIGALTANRSLLLDSNKDLKSDGIGETRAAYNSTTQAVTSASETNITALVLSVEANKKYLVEIAVATECSGTSGILFGHKFPTGSTFKLTHSGRTNSSIATMNLGNVYTANTGLINNPVNTAASATGSYVASCLLVTTNAGNYQLTFASVSGAQTSTIREYGHIKLTEIP